MPGRFTRGIFAHRKCLIPSSIRRGGAIVMMSRTSRGLACGLGLLLLSVLAGWDVPPEDVVERLLVTTAFVVSGVMLLADANHRRHRTQGSRRQR